MEQWRERESEREREDRRDYARVPVSQQQHLQQQQHHPSSQHHHPQQHHLTWNNQQPPSPSPPPPQDDPKKSNRRKVKKSESESGIAKLFKTLRKEGGFGRKSSERDGKEGSLGRRGGRSPERKASGGGAQVRRGSLDRSPTRRRNSSPDRRRAKSMDRRAEYRDRTPERASASSRQSSHAQLLRLAHTPERPVFYRPPVREPHTPGRTSLLSRDAFSTPERANNSQMAAASMAGRGRTPERGLKNGNVLRDSGGGGAERDDPWGLGGTPERRCRCESTSDSSCSSYEPPAPRLKDYYSTNTLKSCGSNGYPPTRGHPGGQPHLPEPKRRLYKENHTDLSI